MRKMLLAMLALIAYQAGAQTAESRVSTESATRNDSTIQVAPVLGIPFMMFKGDEVSSKWKSAGGLSTGALVEIGSGYVTLQTGLLYNAYTIKAEEGSAKAQFDFHYLALPLLGKVNFMGNANRTVYMKLGLMPSQLTYKNYSYEYAGFKNSSNDLEMYKFDIPVVAGIGGAINVASNKAIIVEGNYVRGVKKINKGPENYRLEGVVISGGFSFGF